MVRLMAMYWVPAAYSLSYEKREQVMVTVDLPERRELETWVHDTRMGALRLSINDKAIRDLNFPELIRDGKVTISLDSDQKEHAYTVKCHIRDLWEDQRANTVHPPMAYRKDRDGLLDPVRERELDDLDDAISADGCTVGITDDPRKNLVRACSTASRRDYYRRHTYLIR